LDYVCYPTGADVEVYIQEISKCAVTEGDCEDDASYNLYRVIPDKFTNLQGIVRCYGYEGPDCYWDADGLSNITCMNVVAVDTLYSWGIVYLQWSLNCSTGLVDFVLRGSYNPAYTSGIVAIGSFPQDWYLADIELTAVDPRASNIIVSTSCASTIPCESLDCFPDCISGTEECDGETPWHALLFIEIGLNSAPGFENFAYDEGDNAYIAGPILTADETAGSYFEEVSFRMWCEGGTPHLRILRRVWHSYDDYDVTFVEHNGPISIECFGGEVTITVGVYVIFSNNNGLL